MCSDCSRAGQYHVPHIIVRVAQALTSLGRSWQEQPYQHSRIFERPLASRAQRYVSMILWITIHQALFCFRSALDALIKISLFCNHHVECGMLPDGRPDAAPRAQKLPQPLSRLSARALSLS